MDAPIVHSHADGEAEDHPEKQSVMKKMKARAKKMKNSITGHGHQGHDQDVQQAPDDDLEEEDDEDSPVLHHGEPSYDSDTKKTDAPGDIRSGRDEHANVTDPIRSSVPGLHGTTGNDATHNSGATRRSEYDSVVPKEKNNLMPGQSHPTTGHEEPKGLGGGTHAPHNTPDSSLPKYDTSTMDIDQVNTPGSGKGGLLGESRLGKTDVLGEETPLPQSTPAASRGHGTHKNDMDVDPKKTFGKDYETKSTDPTKSGGEDTPLASSFDKMNLHGDANQDKSTGSHDQISPDKPSNQGTSYIGSATSAITSTALLAKNAVASKLGYGATEPPEHVTDAGKSNASPVEHQNRVLDPSTNEFRPTETPQVRGTVLPDHKAETDLKQSNQAGGTYTGKITSATSVITDRALSAKNAVASKLGYGASDQVQDSGNVPRTNVQSGSTQPDQQSKPMTSTVTEKLSPVYGKVAGAGTAVMSKFKGGSTATTTGRDTSTGDVNQAGQGKGVSMKDYVMEKLRPGEEDKALSEVINEKLKPQKSGKEQTEASAKPMGKVTESEEVKQHLGNTEGNDNTMTNKIEDSVGTMLRGTDKNDDEQKRGLASSGAAADTGAEDRKGYMRSDA